MKTILATLFVIITLYSCNSFKNRDTLSTTDTEVMVKSADFIDVDLKYFTDTVYLFGHKEIPKEDMKKIKTVIHRIYSNIELKNNQYFLKIKNGADVNISENIFNIYRDNINKLNKEAVKSSENGIELSPITEEYLNSLLSF